MIIFVVVVFLSDLLRNILKCNFSPYSTLMTIYFPGAISLCSNVLNHSSMRKVHLVNDHVVYVYWIDTFFVKNNLPTEGPRIVSYLICPNFDSLWLG